MLEARQVNFPAWPCTATRREPGQELPETALDWRLGIFVGVPEYISYIIFYLYVFFFGMFTKPFLNYRKCNKLIKSMGPALRQPSGSDFYSASQKGIIPCEVSKSIFLCGTKMCTVFRFTEFHLIYSIK